MDKILEFANNECQTLFEKVVRNKTNKIAFLVAEKCRNMEERQGLGMVAPNGKV